MEQSFFSSSCFISFIFVFDFVSSISILSADISLGANTLLVLKRSGGSIVARRGMGDIWRLEAPSAKSSLLFVELSPSPPPQLVTLLLASNLSGGLLWPNISELSSWLLPEEILSNREFDVKSRISLLSELQMEVKSNTPLLSTILVKSSTSRFLDLGLRLVVA